MQDRSKQDSDRCGPQFAFPGLVDSSNDQGVKRKSTGFCQLRNRNGLLDRQASPAPRFKSIPIKGLTPIRFPFSRKPSTYQMLFLGAFLLTAFLAAATTPIPIAWAGPSYPAYQAYRVAPGDTLWLLSQRYGGTVEEITKLNGLTGFNLEVGQAMFLPVTYRDGGTSYTVNRGDTIYLISRRWGRSIEEIKRFNGLSNDLLYPGQTLLLPLGRDGYVPHLVSPGETLYLLAKKYGLDLDKLRRENALFSDQLLAGQVIVVPGTLGEPVRYELPFYRVQEGDSLSNIAYRFQTSEQALAVTNRLNSNIIMPGQPLFLPAGKNAGAVEGPRGTQVPNYGELLDWQWARWIYNIGARARITDLKTGLAYNAVYMGGSNHADSEPLTAADTAVAKKIFDGSWSWDKRAVLLTVGDRVLAASIAGQPHDVETITDNNFPGHFDIYFLNSRSHNTNSLNPEHQALVLQAAGY